MLLCDFASIPLSLFPALSFSICLFAFPGGIAGQWTECFLELAWEAKAKADGKSFHSQRHNTLFMKPHVLLLFKLFSQHRKLHPPSLWSHHLRSYFHRGKKVLFVKYWLSKMRPQGLDGREYQIPQASMSHWWIMEFYSIYLFPHPTVTLLDIITQALHANCHIMQTVMHHLSVWKYIIMLI